MKKNSFFSFLMYFIAAAFLCYEMALQVSPSVMTSSLMREFRVDAHGLGVMAAFYFFSYTLMQIPAGIAFDRLGAKFLVVISILICSIGAWLFALTHYVETGSLGRLFMGVGSAFAFIGVLVVATRWFTEKYFAFLVGGAQLLAALGALGGELPLAILVEDFGWRGAMYGLFYTGLGLTFVTLILFQDHPEGKVRRVNAKKSRLVTSLKAIVSNVQIYFVALYAFCSWAPVTVFAALWGVPYLVTRFDFSTVDASFYTSLVWVGIGSTAPLLGYFSDRMHKRLILLSTTAIVGLVASFLLFFSPLQPGWLMAFICLALGFASAGQILTFAVVRDITKPSVVGTAIGINNMAVVAGGALFQPFVGWILAQNWNGVIVNHVPVYSIQAYTLAFSLIPICFLICLCMSLFAIKETHCKPLYDIHTDDLLIKD